MRNQAGYSKSLQQEATVQLQQASLQVALAHRECIQQVEGLQAHRNPLRQAGAKLPGLCLPRRCSCMVDLMSLDPSTTLADFSRARDSQISFSVTHGWSAFWRGRPWLAGHRIGETSSDVGSSRFWIGWVTKHGDKCARSTCRD